MCGIYFLLKDKNVVYIGMSLDILARIRMHMESVQFDAFTAYSVSGEIEKHRLNPSEAIKLMRFREACEIEKHHPELNQQRPAPHKRFWALPVRLQRTLMKSIPDIDLSPDPETDPEAFESHSIEQGEKVRFT